MEPGSQGDWTGMHVNNDDFNDECTSQWGWQTLLSEHVSCVTVTSKMTEQVEKRTYIEFCVMLEHCTKETIQMIQRATAMGNW